MPRIHILPEPRGRERAGASEAAAAADTARAAAAVAAEPPVARAAVAEAPVAAERSRRCRERRPHRPRRGSRLRVAVPLARSLGQSAAAPELAAQTEGTAGDPEHPKSLASSPHLPLQAPRDGCRVGVGVAGGEGWDCLSTSPPPSCRPLLQPPHVPRTGRPGGEKECSFPRRGGWKSVKREKGAAGAAGTGQKLTAGPARRSRKAACRAGPPPAGARSPRPPCPGDCPVPRGGRLPSGRVRPPQLGLGARSCTLAK